jgi:opacity protein-like surface antigen
MNRISLIITMLCLVLFSHRSYSQAFEQGKTYISLGYGTGTAIGWLFSGTTNQDDFSKKFIGPIYAKGEYAISEDIGIGLNVAYFRPQIRSISHYRNGIAHYEMMTLTTTSFLFRLNYHLGENDHIDPYLGMGLGYRTGITRYTNTDPLATNPEDVKTVFPVGFDLTLGARFMITENIGIYSEVGIAKSILQFGLTAKL